MCHSVRILVIVLCGETILMQALLLMTVM